MPDIQACRRIGSDPGGPGIGQLHLTSDRDPKDVGGGRSLVEGAHLCAQGEHQGAGGGKGDSRFDRDVAIVGSDSKGIPMSLLFRIASETL